MRSRLLLSWLVIVLAMTVLVLPGLSLAASNVPKGGKGPKWRQTPIPTATSTPRATTTPTPSATSTPTPSATSTPQVTHTPTPTTTPVTSPPSGTLPTLLKAYLIHGPQPDYEIVRYRPRQFAVGLDADAGDKVARVDSVGPYAGWDVLNTPNREISTVMNMSNWLELTLDRPATLAVVWRGGSPLPSWLSGWSRGQDVVINGRNTPTYTRSFSTGNVTLGSVYDPQATDRYSRDTYLVLFGEANGTPTKAPAVPAGREAPQPNQTCPAWVHDQYVTTGPDGKTYPTWHPQIDPVYWCYFHHEHGSDPSPHKPAFGYAGAQMDMSEPHPGFKVYKFASGDVTVIATHHFGTANAVGAACTRFHGYEIAAYRNGVLAGNVTLMADHGKSQHARTDTDLRPRNCPDQAAEADADGSNGVRKFQVATMDPVGYEPWRIDFRKVVITRLASITINTHSRIADCNTLECFENVPTGDQGEFRAVQYAHGFGIQAGQYTGEFYSDVYGRTILPAGAPGAVRQYVAPGANAVLPDLPAATDECYQDHPFGGKYVCQDISPINENQNIEGALRSPN